ncbi:MAG: hypothetical protein M3066_06530 [Actinomycetota bacterium]|nr:hypothetical protein [Actinomycetota bacterium]
MPAFVGSPDAEGPYNVVAVFAPNGIPLDAFQALGDAGFSADECSLLAREGAGHDPDPDTLELKPHYDAPEVSGQEALRMAGGAAEEGLIGTAAGTALGLIAGAVALAIPGVGPAIGIGIWGYVVGGATIGTASGMFASSVSHRWEIRYRDLVRQGRILVGAHVAGTDRALRAVAVLREFDPEDVEVFDGDGNLHELSV